MTLILSPLIVPVKVRSGDCPITCKFENGERGRIRTCDPSLKSSPTFGIPRDFEEA